jgi:hypothetical protein
MLNAQCVMGFKPPIARTKVVSRSMPLANMCKLEEAAAHVCAWVFVAVQNGRGLKTQPIHPLAGLAENQSDFLKACGERH